MIRHRQPEFGHWQSTGQAKSYSVDVEVQQGILCRSTELSTLFCGKTAILRQSRLYHAVGNVAPMPVPGTLGFRQEDEVKQFELLEGLVGGHELISARHGKCGEICVHP